VGRALLSDPLWLTKVRMGHREHLKEFTAAAMAELVM